MRLTITLTLLLFAALALTAADINGKWTGSIDVKMPDGEMVNFPLHFEPAQNGDEVTGTIGREPEEKLPIQNGKMAGSKLTFEVTPPEGGYPVKFELTVDGAKMEGTLKGDTDSGPVSGTATLTKAE